MSKQPLYGFPCVTDPHDFDPDVECCSPVEIETWRRACANYGKPTFEPNKGGFSEHDAEGNLVLACLPHIVGHRYESDFDVRRMQRASR